MDYSTKNISTKLIQEIVEAVHNVRGWGSVEIFVQDYKVVQITERSIKKTFDVIGTKNGKVVKLAKQKA